MKVPILETAWATWVPYIYIYSRIKSLHALLSVSRRLLDRWDIQMLRQWELTFSTRWLCVKICESQILRLLNNSESPRNVSWKATQLFCAVLTASWYPTMMIQPGWHRKSVCSQRVVFLHYETALQPSPCCRRWYLRKERYLPLAEQSQSGLSDGVIKVPGEKSWSHSLHEWLTTKWRESHARKKL